MKGICVYCGSNPGSRPAYMQTARRLGSELAGRSLRLVYGGASVGTMGAVADACLAAGGEVLGVIPRTLVEREVAHLGLTQQLVVDSLHQRKALMLEHSDASIALPGGHGTLDELFETLTWLQLGLHTKPIGLLDEDGFWRHLLAHLDSCVSEGFLKPEHRELLVVDTSTTGLLAQLEERIGRGL